MGKVLYDMQNFLNMRELQKEEAPLSGKYIGNRPYIDPKESLSIYIKALDKISTLLEQMMEIYTSGATKKNAHQQYEEISLLLEMLIKCFAFSCQESSEKLAKTFITGFNMLTTKVDLGYSVGNIQHFHEAMDILSKLKTLLVQMRDVLNTAAEEADGSADITCKEYTV